MRTILCAVVALLVLPASAQAAWVHDANSVTTQPYAGWAATSYSPAPNANVFLYTDGATFCNEGGQSTTSCAVPDEGSSEIHIGSSLYPRQVFLHELGHVFDYTMMTDPARVSFENLIRDHRDWQATPSSPHEKFAEAYRMCAYYGTRYNPDLVLSQYGAGYGYLPSIKTEHKICALIQRVGTGT